MNTMTDCELACQNSERALVAEILKEIYKLKSEDKTDGQIIELIIQKLTIKMNKTK